MKHIIITGPRGAGKSTLVHRLIYQSSRRISGFFTKREDAGADGFHPIYMHPAACAKAEWVFEEGNRVGVCDGRSHRTNAEAFDVLGTELLRPVQGGIIVMDELGFMESGAKRFTRRVLETLDGDIPVIAVVKDRQDIPFLGQVLSHNKAEVYRLTEQNREELYNELVPLILEWNKLKCR